MKKSALIAIIRFMAQGHDLVICIQKMPSERLSDLANQIADDKDFPSEISSYAVISNCTYSVREIHQIKTILVWFKIQEHQDSIRRRNFLKRRKRILINK